MTHYIAHDASGMIVCQLARDYLLSFDESGVTEELLDHYLEPDRARLQPLSLNGVYERLLISAQNAGMRSGVIGGSIGGVNRLGAVLFEFDPQAVTEAFDSRWSQMLDAVEATLEPRGKIRRTARSIWPLFCRAALSGAEFLSRFANADDFYQWVDVFDGDDRLRPALPMALSYEIEGFGFPLACDFLKELGYLNFAKPDVHIKGILRGLELTSERSNDYQTYRALLRVAEDARLTPYHVDKLLWLVGSGFFYDHPDVVGRKGRIRTDKHAFIASTRRVLRLGEPAG
jgi:hypothetical protein